jgi:hypothetical protein
MSTETESQFKYFTKYGYTSIDCLEFLKGQPYDELAMGYVQSLRPSMVRICKDRATLDMRQWRVTIWLDEKSNIKRIEQEVHVGLPDGIANAHELYQVFKARSPRRS